MRQKSLQCPSCHAKHVSVSHIKKCTSLRRTRKVTKIIRHSGSIPHGYRIDSDFKK